MRNPDRLGAATLTRARHATRPPYARDALAAAVVHLGLGAFARAHLATYADDLVALGEPGAAISGISLHARATVDALARQDGLYTLIETDGVTAALRIIGSVADVGHGPSAAVDAIAAPMTQAVTLTITEKGYHHRVGGGLDTTAPAIAHDLEDPSHPRSAPGVLVAALARRKQAGLGGLTIVPADNLAANGVVANTVVTGLADRIDPGLAEWIESQVCFASTVVDRIVPATTAADLATVSGRMDLADEVPVRAEPYRSWVVEQAQGLPAWDRVGARFVDDVAPYEAHKLRTINAPHTALALLGGLAGHDTIDEAATDPVLAAFVRRMIEDEVAPCLPVLDGPGHADASDDPVGVTLARFANPTLGHRCTQVATDTSQKLPQRIIAPLLDAAHSGNGFHRLALIAAAWAAWVARSVGNPAVPLADPMAEQLIGAARRASPGPTGVVEALLELDAVFPPEVAESPTIRHTITDAAQLLDARGPHGAAEAWT